MQSLEDFITAVTAESKVHICIYDVSGITRREPFCVDASRKIHASKFCERAKAVRHGLRLCMRCRALADAKAERFMEPFEGRCPFGVTELAYPVADGERLLCVVYVGLIAEDSDAVKKKIVRTAKRLNVSPKGILEMAQCLQECSDISKYKKLAQAVGEYILLLYGVYGISREGDGYSEIVAAALDYAAASYKKDISLEDVTKRYGMNAKYVGRLFKEQTGNSFAEYLNGIRISHAKQLLRGTAAPIIEIALECGYNNVTYFNRVFRNVQGMTPRQYRGKKK